MRLQTMIVEKLDSEFKMFMRWRGINIDGQLFELRLNEPQNFAKYRQAEVDAARITAFTQLEAVPYLSKRFLLTRYLDLSEEEMQQNDEMWAEEHEDSAAPVDTDAGLRAVGVTPASIEGDMSNLEMPEIPAEGEPAPEAGGLPPPTGVPPASAPPPAGM